MKGKLFTKSHDVTLLQQVDNQGGQFTAEEHAFVIEKEFADAFSSKDNLMLFSLKNVTTQVSLRREKE